MKKLRHLSAVALLLSACANAPSPQDTSPSQAAQCKALKIQMTPTGNPNNTPHAVLNNEQDSLRDTYQQTCEQAVDLKA